MENSKSYLPVVLREGIEKVSRMFPNSAIQERIGQNLRVIHGYEWEFPEEREKALEHVKATFQALDLGYLGQAQQHFRKAEDSLFFDYANQAIRIANNNGLHLKPLAKLNEEPGHSFYVDGPRHKWEFKPLDSYNKLIPPQALNLAKGMQDLGLKWGKNFIGEPYVPPAPSYADYHPAAYSPVKAYKDPILAISIGRWVLEVARWE